MNDYLQLRINADPCSADVTDLLAAFLADEGFESFEPDANGLTAFAPVGSYDAEAVEAILADFPIPTALTTESSVVEGKDWNEEWEKNYFRPILAGGGKVAVHATFHKDVPHALYDIVIDPRMAFGTGHHATTSMMMAHILDINPKDMDVTDMGTGTAILAILAHMLGAHSVSGIEIDPMACDNARDNAALNKAGISLICGDSTALKDIPKADLFLANINRNVILADIDRYADAMKEHAVLVLSGFFQTDIPLIEAATASYGFKTSQIMTEGEWASIRLSR